MSSILTGQRWVIKTLKADSTLMGLVRGIYDGSAPKSAQYPFLAVTSQSPARAIKTVNQRTVMFDEILLVKGVDKGNSYGRLELALNRVRALLDPAAASGSVNGTTVTGTSGSASGMMMGCTEEGPGVQYEEQRDGVEYRHLGLRFRVWTK